MELLTITKEKMAKIIQIYNSLSLFYERFKDVRNQMPSSSKLSNTVLLFSIHILHFQVF